MHSLRDDNAATTMDSPPLTAASLTFSATISPENDATTDPRLPLLNLSMLQQRIDSLQRFLHQNIQANTLIDQDQMYLVSNEITSSLQQVILNGIALLSCCQQEPSIRQEDVKPPAHVLQALAACQGRGTNAYQLSISPIQNRCETKVVTDDEVDDGDFEIVELDEVELLAENIHRCEICGKGFKRDANLRMHRRAHGNEFKTLEALTRTDRKDQRGYMRRKTRFSCPFIGCNRNKLNSAFKPLKTAICLKNHFKRSHCPKLFSCNRCNKKSFSVVADLKSHQKHCGRFKWRCSCGKSFPRKNKLFGHMAQYDGHMPEGVSSEGTVLKEVEEDGYNDELEEEEEEEEEEELMEVGMEVKPKVNCSDEDDQVVLDGIFQLESFRGIDEGRCLTDDQYLGTQTPSSSLGVSASVSDMDELQSLWWSGPY